MNWHKRILDESDTKRVETAIAAAELKTAGEIVCVCARSSSEYRWIGWFWASLGIALASVLLIVQSMNSGWGIGLVHLLEWQLFAAAAFSLLPQIPGVLRATASQPYLAHRVHRAALAQFVEQGLHHTRDHTGVLIYVSELEHRVEILADRGIDQKVSEAYWDEQVKKIVTAIKQGKAADGLVSAVEEIGAKLSAEFPRQADDQNELSDTIRVIDTD